MTPAMHERALEIFETVVDLDGRARSNALDDQCGSDQVLRDAVQRLLVIDATRWPMLDDGLAAIPDHVGNVGPAPSTERALIPETIGPFSIIDELG